MNQTLHDAFAHGLDDAGRLDVDIEALADQGETRLRHRRLAALVGSMAAVILVVAAVAGVTAGDPEGRGNGPVNHPDKNPTPSPTRPIVYSDVNFVPGHAESLLGEPIHVGDRLVDTGSGWIHMDVTDDGVVYASGGYRDDGRLWFTDGGTPEQIASHACPDAHGFPGTVVTGNSGSLAAWFDCTPEQRAELVVYDTSSGREVGRRPIPHCSHAQIGTGECFPAAIIGERVYVRDRVYIAQGGVLISSHGEPAAQAFARDVRNYPRGVLAGDSWETAQPFDGFAVLGRRLVPSPASGPDGDPLSPTSTPVFDTATRRPIHLHLPTGYQAVHDERGGTDFAIFEWLDDDTVALAHTDGPRATDILTCRLSSGRCELAVPARGDGDVFGGVVRVLPGQGLW